MAKRRAPTSNCKLSPNKQKPGCRCIRPFQVDDGSTPLHPSDCTISRNRRLLALPETDLCADDRLGGTVDPLVVTKTGTAIHHQRRARLLKSFYSTASTSTVASSCQFPSLNSPAAFRIIFCTSWALSPRFSSISRSSRASPNSSPFGTHASVTPSVKNTTRSPASSFTTLIEYGCMANTPSTPPPSSRRWCEPSRCITIGAL